MNNTFNKLENHLPDSSMYHSNEWKRGFHLFSSVISSQLVHYFQLPMTMISLFQMVIEYMFEAIGSVIQSIYNASIENDKIHNNQYSLIHSFYLNHLIVIIPWILFGGIFYSIWIILPFFSRHLFSMFRWCVMDCYWTKRIILWFYHHLGWRTLQIENDDIQLDIVNRWLHKKSFFIQPYDRIQPFLREYESMGNEFRPHWMLNYMNLYIPSFHTRFYFEDTQFNVSGYISFTPHTFSKVIYHKKQVITEQDKSKHSDSLHREIIHLSFPILTLSCSIEPEKYLKQIKQQLVNEKRNITYYYIYPLQWDETKNRFYDARIRQISSYQKKGGTEHETKIYYRHELKQRYIDTFFHPQKEKIWNLLQAIEFTPQWIEKHGQYPQECLCLHGPPGTGKSSFAFRIAQSLMRGVVHVDLQSIYRKSSLFALFSECEIKQIKIKPSNCVYVFDEFDRGLTFIQNQTDMIQRRRQQRENLLDRLLRNSHSENKEQKSKDNSNNTTSFELYKEILSESERDNELITMEDLMELIQGITSNPGMIVIATTNHYSTIQSMCPRLFREGRFRPVPFEYPSKQIINEMSEFYFQQTITNEIDNLPNVFDIPTSRIMHHIMTIKQNYPSTKKQFSAFIQFLRNEIY